MSDFSRFFKDCRSRIKIKRNEIGDPLIQEIVTKIEHGNFVGINRAQVLKIINLLIANRNERQRLMCLLNNVLPKSEKRFKRDSKNRRRKKYYKINRR